MVGAIPKMYCKTMCCTSGRSFASKSEYDLSLQLSVQLVVQLYRRALGHGGD